MLRVLPLVLSVSIRASAALAQSASTYPHPAEHGAFNIVPFDEDWSSLRARSLRTEPTDRLKYIPTGKDARSYLSIGGDFRGVYESVKNDNWSALPAPHQSFGLQRFLLHADLHINPRVRTFVELQSGLEEGRSGGPRPPDEKRLDFLNAFLDVQPVAAERSPTLRLGKQELQLGSGRLLSAREGPNVRQSFYGFRVDQAVGKWKLTGIAVRPAVDRPGFFDGAPQSSVALWGGVVSRTWQHTSLLTFNALYFGLDRKQATYDRGSAREVRQTLSGNFILNPLMGSQRAALHLDMEGMLQFGSFGRQEIRAWSVASETGMTLNHLPLRPLLGLRADVSSGDHGGDRPLGSFNPLFPAGNYFGVFLDTGPGPINFRDVHPKVILQLPHAVTLTPDWIWWWRQSLNDGVYSVPGTLIVPSGASRARYVGNRPGAEIRWQIDRHAYTQISYGVFFAGPFLREASRGQNLNYLACRVGYKF